MAHWVNWTGIIWAHRTEAPSMGPELIYTRFSVCIIMAVFWCSHGNPNSGGRCFSDSFACSWDSFPPIGLPCPALIIGVLFYWILFVISGHCLLETCSFLKRKWRGSGSGRERSWVGARRSEGRESGRGTVVGMYCLKEESISNFFLKKKEKEKRTGF